MTNVQWNIVEFYKLYTYRYFFYGPYHQNKVYKVHDCVKQKQYVLRLKMAEYKTVHRNTRIVKYVSGCAAK